MAFLFLFLVVERLAVICSSHAACFHSSLPVLPSLYLPISVCLPRVFLFSHSTSATPPQLLSSSITSQCRLSPLRECARARVCERQGVGGRWIETMFVSGFCCLLNLICFIGILRVYFKRGNREEKENK